MGRLDAYGQPIGDELSGWQTRPMPPASPLVGRLVRVEPIDPARHGEELYDAYALAQDGRDWTYMAAGPFADRSVYLSHLATQAALRDPRHHAIVSLADRIALGTAAFMRIDPANGVMEIGHIALSPALQRTAAATEAMYLMMRRAFDELGYRRLEWKCDALNARSRRAADRLGFTFEGVFRQAMVVRGRNRDTAWYAIIDKEWPGIRSTLSSWLAPENFDASGHQIRSLATCRNESSD